MSIDKRKQLLDSLARAKELLGVKAEEMEPAVPKTPAERFAGLVKSANDYLEANKDKLPADLTMSIYFEVDGASVEFESEVD